MVSGRPMIVSSNIGNWDAFVAAWLPGTEGAGVADVLFGDYDFQGKLSFTWPRENYQIPINVGDSTYDPLYAFGYGLSYSATTPIPTNPPTSPPTPVPTGTANKGDVNSNGSIDIVDALLVAQYYVGLPVTIDLVAADVNCNGTVDIVDALLIAQYYVGLISQFC